MRRALTLGVLTTASLALLWSAAAGAAPTLKVTGLTTIGSFAVNGGDPVSAQAAFGKPAHTSETGSSCTMTWSVIEIGFYTLLDTAQCGPNSAFDEATVTGAWVTDRGLHRGDTIAKARQLYPKAKKTSFVAGLGLVVKFSPAIGDYGMGVRTKEGHVTDLVVFNPQGGE